MSASFWGAFLGGFFGGPLGAVVGGAIGIALDSLDKAPSHSNEHGSLLIHDPNFDTFDQGVRGIGFPFNLKLINVPSKNILVGIFFRDQNNKPIKSLLPELATEDGTCVLHKNFYANRPNLELNDSLFVPYGIFDITETQTITARIYVFIDNSQTPILSRDVAFTYFVYNSDHREHGGLTDHQGNDFEALIGLIASVIKADGIVAPEEIRTVIEFFKTANAPSKDQLKNRLKHYLKHLPSIDDCCETVNKTMDTQDKYIIVGLLLNISVSDGVVHPLEITMIENISNLLGIPKNDFYEMKKDFITDEMKKDFITDEMKKDFITGKQKLYEILDLKIGATKEEIKAAYRAKCKEFHPDQYQSLPQGMQKLAEEKFKEIQGAYDELTKDNP